MRAVSDEIMAFCPVAASTADQSVVAIHIHNVIAQRAEHLGLEDRRA
jgi:hypothetical protein